MSDIGGLARNKNSRQCLWAAIDSGGLHGHVWHLRVKFIDTGVLEFDWLGRRIGLDRLNALERSIGKADSADYSDF